MSNKFTSQNATGRSVPPPIPQEERLLCPQCNRQVPISKMDMSGFCRDCATAAGSRSTQADDTQKAALRSSQATPPRLPPVAPPPLPGNAAPTPTGPNEITFPSSLPATMGRVADAIKRLGSVTEQNQLQQYVTGRIKFGLQSVKVRVSVVPAGPGQCRVVLQGSSDDVWGAGAKSATRRLMEMLRNLDNPGYQPDRLGMHPLALAGVIVGFVILMIIIMGLISKYL